MLRNTINELFAPIKGVLYKGGQVYAFVQNEQVFFCDKDRSSLNREFVNGLDETIGLVYVDNLFVYLDEFSKAASISNVFIINKFGSFIFYEQITAYDRISNSLFVLNSTRSDAYSEKNTIQLHNGNFFFRHDEEKNLSVLSNGKKEFGKYLGNISADYVVTEDGDGNFAVISVRGITIKLSSCFLIHRNHNNNVILFVEDNKLTSLTLETNNVKQFYITEAWRAINVLATGEVDMYDNYMIVYNQQGGWENPELTYFVLDGDNDICSFFYFNLCMFKRITGKGVLVHTFDKDIEEVRHYYDDEPSYDERTISIGYALISFDGVLMGCGDRSDCISVGCEYNFLGCEEIYDSTPGFYLVDNNVFIETPDAKRIRLIKTNNYQHYTAIVENGAGLYGMYFDDKKILDYVAHDIIQLDCKWSDLKEAPAPGFRNNDDKESDYFKCIIDNRVSIIYGEHVIAEDVTNTQFLSITSKGKCELLDDYLLVTMSTHSALFHHEDVLYELDLGESVKGVCLIDNKALYRIYDRFGRVGLLYEDEMIFSPTNTSISCCLTKDGTPDYISPNVPSVAL